MGFLNRGLAKPTLAAHFPTGTGLSCGHGPGEHRTEIEIAGDTFFVKAIETEHGLREIRISRVFKLAVPADAFRAKVGQFHRQRFQFLKLL